MKKSVAIELDKVRNLRLGINAICMIEELTDKPIKELMSRASIRELRIILYCGFVWEDEYITLEHVGELMEEHDLDMIGNKIGEAFELAFPDQTKKKVRQTHPAMKKK